MNELDVIKQTAVGAGKIVKSDCGTINHAQYKSDGSLVSHADLRAEKFIIDELQRYYPDYSLYSEETGIIEGRSSDKWWIVDPVDGSHNFINGLPEYAVCIALEVEQQIIYGAIYLPEFDLLLHAARGQGAFCNGQRLKVSQRSLETALINYEAIVKNTRQWQICKRVYETFQTRLRTFYCTAYAVSMLAMGRIDACFSANDKLYDFAAGAVIVEEAEGKVSSIHGEAIGNHSSFPQGFIATNAIFHQQLVAMLRDYNSPDEV